MPTNERQPYDEIGGAGGSRVTSTLPDEGEHTMDNGTNNGADKGTDAVNNVSHLIFGREPVLIMAAIEALVGVITVFGLELSGEQSAAILILVGAVLTLVARQHVTPTVKVQSYK